MRTLAHQPFGKYLLTLLAIGLAGYSMWRLFRAALGRGPEGSDQGFDRLAALGSGLAYGAMCVLAVEILLGAGSSSSASPKKSAAGVLGWPAGAWIVGLVGAGLIGIALYQGYRGVSQKFLDDSKVEEMPPAVKTWIGRSGRSGIWRAWSCSASSGSSSSRLPSTSIRARRSASTARWPSSRTPPTVPTCSESSPSA